jgi:hypothetical protein
MRVAVLAFLIVLSAGCMESGPDSVGELLRKSQGELESELSISLGEWEPWQPASGYSFAYDYDHTVSFYGHDWYLTAFRCDSLIDGILLEAPYPGRDEFRELTEEIAWDEQVQSDDKGIAWVQDVGNLVHFRADPDEGMFLMVTDHHMSATYESTLLIDELQFLEDAMRPWTDANR